MRTTTEYTLNIYGSDAQAGYIHALHWDPPDMQMCDLRCTCTSNSVYGGTVGDWWGSGKHAGEKRELICVTHTQALFYIYTLADHAEPCSAPVLRQHWAAEKQT